MPHTHHTDEEAYEDADVEAYEEADEIWRTREFTKSQDNGTGGQESGSEKRQAQYRDYPLENIEEPLKHDVMCGRGANTNYHAGNKRFRNMVDDQKNSYVNSSKKQKSLIASEVVHQWRQLSPPGRFLEYNKCTEYWDDVGDKRAEKKTIQALRENAPQIREQQNREDHSGRQNNSRSEGSKNDQQIPHQEDVCEFPSFRSTCSTMGQPENQSKSTTPSSPQNVTDINKTEWYRLPPCLDNWQYDNISELEPHIPPPEAESNDCDLLYPTELKRATTEEIWFPNQEFERRNQESERKNHLSTQDALVLWATEFDNNSTLKPNESIY